ncbi:MAG: hypothetical protein EON95_18715 [Caulobacteraceae bacterium]|nr:MAG: hypothetical protein EON95_18715 [Caulobacteraceae bacterium]
MVAALVGGDAVAADGPRLRPTQLGAFAMFTDLDSIERTGATAKFRVLQVTETGFTAGGVAYVGGWRWFEVDCTARTARGLGFASVRADGVEGPVTGGGGEVAKIAPGGIEDEAARVVCDDAAPLGAPDIDGVDAAVAAGRRWIPTGETD